MGTRPSQSVLVKIKRPYSDLASKLLHLGSLLPPPSPPTSVVEVQQRQELIAKIVKNDAKLENEIAPKLTPHEVSEFVTIIFDALLHSANDVDAHNAPLWALRALYYACEHNLAKQRDEIITNHLSKLLTLYSLEEEESQVCEAALMELSDLMVLLMYKQSDKVVKAVKASLCDKSLWITARLRLLSTFEKVCACLLNLRFGALFCLNFFSRLKILQTQN